MWLLELEGNPTKWRSVVGISQGELLPLNEIYVDLFAVPEQELQQTRNYSQFKQFQEDVEFF